MRKLRALFVRFAHLLRVRPSDSEFADELESHIAVHVDECVRAMKTDPMAALCCE